MFCDKKNKHRCAPGVCPHATPTIFKRTKTMNTKDLIRLGVPPGEPIALAHEFIQNFIAQGKDGALLEGEIFNIVANPPAFFADELRAPLARAIYRPAFTPRAELAPWRQWGEGLEPDAVKQMANACALPVAVAGALMPDAHVGYGLPIGGVLATDNAVIPYAVGVDIACRMKLTVYDRNANIIAGQRDRLANIIEDETRFGMGCEFKDRREHEVMDEDWTVSPVTQHLRDKAWKQLGTSGSAITSWNSAPSLQMRSKPQELGLEARRIPRAALALGLARHGRAGVRLLQQARDGPPRALAQGTQTPRLALARRRRRPGILGGDEPDGPLRRREPRAHSRARRQEARRAPDPRHREPPQLRVERNACG